MFNYHLNILKGIVSDVEECSVYRGRDGVIVYVPESENPFSDPNWHKKFNFDNDDDQ